MKNSPHTTEAEVFEELLDYLSGIYNTNQKILDCLEALLEKQDKILESLECDDGEHRFF